MRGGFPLKTMNVYLIEDEGGGVTMFEAGIKAMVAGLSAAASSLGGLNRIVLGHAHADHRGAAPGAGRADASAIPPTAIDAEGDGGMHYFDFSKVSRARALDDPAAAAGVGRRPGRRSPARSRRATTSRASGSSTSPATRPARSRCGASPTASR